MVFRVFVVDFLGLGREITKIMTTKPEGRG